MPKKSIVFSYGFAGLGQVVVETKSGSGTFHGSAWDYLRNNAFDAANYFSTGTSALHQNIYGYTLGGPVIIPKLYNTDRSKKTFFFASNQWQTISAGSVIRAAVFPQAMRDGDFSSSPTLKGNLTLDAHSQALLASEGRTNCITGPTTLNPACLDPVAVGLLKAYVPLPNNVAGGFQNYLNQDPQTTSQIDYQFRGDHQINRNNLLIGRIMYEQVINAFPNDSWGGTPYNTITNAYYTTGFNGVVRLQSAITPDLMNTAYGPPSYDFTNDITATWVYAIPYFRHSNRLFKLTLGDWNLGGLFLHQSGFALSPGMSSGTQGLAARPNQLAPYHKVGKLSEWFDKSAFVAPAYGFYGNARNGTIRGPGYTSFNLSLNKTFSIHDRLAMQIRAEAFNALNHPNFRSVDTGLGDGSYGQVNSAGDPRIMEFAAKLTF